MKSKIALLLIAMSSLTMANDIVTYEEYVEAKESTKKVKEEIYEPKYNQMSIRFSNISGYGLAYQRNLFFGLALRFTGWAQFNDYKEYDDDQVYKLTENTVFNLGVDIQKNIITENRYRVYGFAAGGYGMRKETQDELNTDTGEYERDHENIDKNVKGLGLGLGFEYKFKYVALDLGLGYKYEIEDQNDIYLNGGLKDTRSRQTGLGVTTGINILF